MNEPKCGKCQGPLDTREPGIGICTTCTKDFEEWEKGRQVRPMTQSLGDARRKRRNDHQGDHR